MNKEMSDNKLVEIYNFIKEIYPDSNHISIEVWPGGIKTEVQKASYWFNERSDKIFDLMSEGSEE